MNSAQALRGPSVLSWFKSSHSSEEGGACIEVAYAWRKSSRSTEQGGDCIEVAHAWSKSSHSASEGDACVEVASAPATVLVRDSKVPDGPNLTLTPAAWAAFTSSL